MVTTLVLLNRFSTCRTLLGVCHNPSNVLTLVGVFQSPLLGSGAVTRSMRLVTTFEAEYISTFTVNFVCAHVLVFYTVVTSLVRTPPDILVIISK